MCVIVTPFTDTIWMPFLTNILPGIAVILTCLICGFVVCKLRKRCCKQNSNISTAAEVGLFDVDLGNSMVLEMVHTDIYPHTNYYTIGEDSTGGLRTVIDKTDASGTSYCPIKQNIPSENLEEICLQSDEDAYIHPI